jgi:beta-lactamase superfamily II metal-dependent hydrolase
MNTPRSSNAELILLFSLLGFLLPSACGKSDDGSGAPQTTATSAGGSAGASTAQGAGGQAGADTKPDAAGGSRDATGGGSSGGATGGAGGASGGSAAGGAGGSAGASPDAGSGGAMVDGGTAPLRIYWVDAEGGAATVIWAPNGQTLVVDAGFTGTRDANRIAAVLKDEIHATKIDYMLTTHYHIDHVGGVPTLASLVPVTTFLDHGATVEPGTLFNAYQTATASATRTTVKPGDKLTFGDLQIVFVTAAGEVVDPPLPQAIANPTCAGATMKSEVAGAENPMSIGFVARFGNFDFVVLGDLTWNIEQKLMCPTNRIGPVDLYQVDHHGMDISSPPQLVHALAPSVAVMNNGAAKGGSPATFDVLRASPGFRDLWSLHRVTANDAQHNADDALTANTTGADQAFGIKAVVERDGTFTLTNARTGMSRTYASR